MQRVRDGVEPDDSDRRSGELAAGHGAHPGDLLDSFGDDVGVRQVDVAAWPLSQAMSYGVFVARLGMARQEAPGRETVTANSPLASVGSVDMQWAKVSVSVQLTVRGYWSSRADR